MTLFGGVADCLDLHLEKIVFTIPNINFYTVGELHTAIGRPIMIPIDTHPLWREESSFVSHQPKFLVDTPSVVECAQILYSYNMPIFYHSLLIVNSNESRQSVLVNLPGYPDLAIVCVQHIKDWEEPEEVRYANTGSFFWVRPNHG